MTRGGEIRWVTPKDLTISRVKWKDGFLGGYSSLWSGGLGENWSEANGDIRVTET